MDIADPRGKSIFVRPSGNGIATRRHDRGSGAMILVAEDDIINQIVMMEQLNNLGYTAKITANGREALKALENENYALLLTDCHMPEMDGYELTSAIRDGEKDSARRLPIIAITANAPQGEGDRCLAAGMDDILSKPVELQDLKDMLKKWIPEPKPVAGSSERRIPGQPTAAGNGTPLKEAPIDMSIMVKLVGDNPKLHQRLLKRFVETAPANVEEMIKAHEEGFLEGVGREAHKLKSSARAIGANELADLCQLLEQAGKSGDVKTVGEDIGKLSTGLKVAIDYIDGLDEDDG